VHHYGEDDLIMTAPPGTAEGTLSPWWPQREERAAFFEMVERRFARQARLTTLIGNFP
jgi:hypothetical protein